MAELNKGDLVISNDLIGFCVDSCDSEVVLNTSVGVRLVKNTPAVTRLATASEVAAAYAKKLMEVVNSL